MEIAKLIGTSLLSVVALFVITKIMGHKQIAQLDFFDYVSGITIGSIGAELATDLEEPWKPLIALAIYGGISICFNLLTQRLQRSRKYVNGAPTILMSDGKIFREKFKEAKLDLSEFMLLCRERGFFDPDEIQAAVFENNGKLSILPKSSSRPATTKDLGIEPEIATIGTEVIMDGQILDENLKKVGVNEKWLKKQISARGYKDEKEIFLGVLNPKSGKLSLYSNS